MQGEMLYSLEFYTKSNSDIQLSVEGKQSGKKQFRMLWEKL